MTEQFLNTPEKIQAAIGKCVAWETQTCRPKHIGTLKEVKGKNLLVFENYEPNWLWLPNIFNLRIAPPPVVGVDPCHSDRDGDCSWCNCPQNRDGEPHKTGRHCPLDKGDDDD